MRHTTVNWPTPPVGRTARHSEAPHNAPLEERFPELAFAIRLARECDNLAVPPEVFLYLAAVDDNSNWDDVRERHIIQRGAYRECKQ